MNKDNWHFVHHRETDAEWTAGLRKIFEYRDLGIAAGTDGDYVAHVIRAVEREDQDRIHAWHYHQCAFQMVYILQGWASFEYRDIGVRTLRQGDCVNQVPGLIHREIECSQDLELLEIVAPADFKTVTLDAEE